MWYHVSPMLRRTIKSNCTPKVDFAKSLRKRMTPGELKLWRRLSGKKFYGLKIRRQAPVGPYIADFLCVEKMAIIEVDGESHIGEEKYDEDQERQKYLEREGFTVLRFFEEEAQKKTDELMDRLAFLLGVLE